LLITQCSNDDLNWEVPSHTVGLLTLIT